MSQCGGVFAAFQHVKVGLVRTIGVAAVAELRLLRFEPGLSCALSPLVDQLELDPILVALRKMLNKRLRHKRLACWQGP